MTVRFHLLNNNLWLWLCACMYGHHRGCEWVFESGRLFDNCQCDWRACLSEQLLWQVTSSHMIIWLFFVFKCWLNSEFWVSGFWEHTDIITSLKVKITHWLLVCGNKHKLHWYLLLLVVEASSLKKPLVWEMNYLHCLHSGPVTFDSVSVGHMQTAVITTLKNHDSLTVGFGWGCVGGWFYNVAGSRHHEKSG